MNIQAVETRVALKKFINFPYLFHRDTPNWIPPLRFDQKNIFNPKKNSILNHCEYQLFLLHDNGEIIGRIVTYINHVANKYWNEEIGFFGHYECIDNQNAVSALLDTAEKWLVERGMKKCEAHGILYHRILVLFTKDSTSPPLFYLLTIRLITIVK